MALIGGFFEIELSSPAIGGLAESWAMPTDAAYSFANARSALAALLAAVQPATFWVPAFICASVVSAAQSSGTPLRYFPIDATLEPDAAYLDAIARPGDMILAVDYFGRPPGAEFLSLVARRPDLSFVEDAAQAVATGRPMWGAWRLHSPRKLVGVPDGGFLAHRAGAGGVSTRALHSQPPGTTDPSIDTSRAAWLRFEDEGEQTSEAWHRVNQSRETAEAITATPMSRLSRELLRRLDGRTIAARRRANYQTLANRLRPLMFMPDSEPSHVPFGCVLQLDAEIRPHVRQALIAAGIFPAIHWETLPSPPSFTAAHRLAAELLTLPCDQRYDAPEMEKIAEIVSEALGR